MPKPKVAISDSSGNEVAVTDNRLDVNLGYDTSIDIGDVEIKGHAAIADGSNTSVSDTTPEYLYGDDTSVPCKHVDIMAATANTGIIYVGGSGVSSSNGIALYSGDVYSINIENLNLVYVIASVDNEDVQWVYYN